MLLARAAACSALLLTLVTIQIGAQRSSPANLPDTSRPAVVSPTPLGTPMRLPNLHAEQADIVGLAESDGGMIGGQSMDARLVRTASGFSGTVTYTASRRSRRSSRTVAVIIPLSDVGALLQPLDSMNARRGSVTPVAATVTDITLVSRELTLDGRWGRVSIASSYGQWKIYLDRIGYVIPDDRADGPRNASNPVERAIAALRQALHPEVAEQVLQEVNR